METEKVIEKTRAKMNNLENHGDLDYYLTIEKAFTKILNNEKMTITSGVDEDGHQLEYEKHHGQEDSLYGRILCHSSDLFRRFGIKYADKVSMYFTNPEYFHCKSCYHRAEYIVHGWLSGLGFFTIGLVLFELIVRG